VQRTRAQLEKENVQLWQRLESIYDELRELFTENDEEDDEEE
jgi:hypothetical protein